VEAARLCSEILLAHAMQCERLRLFTQYEQVPGPDVLAAFRESVRQAAAGRPVAYITGSKEFFSLRLEVTPDVLIPRPETEILVERVIHLVRRGNNPRPAILDLCTGSGCIAIALARHLPEAQLAASDVSPAALAVARRNAERHELDARIAWRCGDLLAPWGRAAAADESAWAPPAFDIIVCNPPYIAESQAATLPVTVREHEPAAALFGGPDGLALVRRVLNEAPARLAPGGHLLCEIAWDQAAAVRELTGTGPWTDLITYRDGGGHERVVHVRRGAAEQTQVA